MISRLIDFAFGILRNKKLMIIMFVSLLVLVIGTGLTLYIIKYMDTRYDYDEDDTYLELPNHTYTLGDYYDRLSYQYGVDVIEYLIDDKIIPDIYMSEPVYSYEYILNKYLYGFDIEEDENVDYHELNEVKKEFYLQRGIYDEYIIYDFEKSFYNQFVYAKSVYEQTLSNRQEYFTSEMYKDAFIEMEDLNKYAFVISFNSLNELKSLLDALDISLNYQNKLIYKNDSSLLNQGEVADLLMRIIGLKYFNNSGNQYFNNYYTYTEYYNNYNDYTIEFDTDRLKELDYDFDCVKFVYSQEELNEMPSVLRNSINKLSVYDQYFSVTKSYELCETNDSIYLVYKIADETAYANEYINHKNVIFNYLLEESFNVDIMNAVLYHNRAQSNIKICNEDLYRKYNTKYESYKDIITNLFGEFIPLETRSKMKFNYILKYTINGEEKSIRLLEYHHTLSKYFGNIVGLEFLEEYMLFNSANNDIYNPYTNKVINQNYYQYCINGESNRSNYLNTVRSVKDAFQNNYYQNLGYSSDYGWENFLKDYFYVKTEDDLFVKLIKDHLLEKTYVDYYDEGDVNNCVQYLYDDFFALKVINLFVYVDNDNDGRPDQVSLNNEDSDLWTEDQKVKAEGLLSTIWYRQQELSGNVNERINNIIAQYKNASFDDPYWTDFMNSNLKVKVENPFIYSNASSIVDEFSFELYDIYNELKHMLYYPFDQIEDFDEPYYDGYTIVETVYGYHIIITLNAYTPYYVEKEEGLSISSFYLDHYKDYLTYNYFNSLNTNLLTKEHCDGIVFYTQQAINSLYDEQYKEMVYNMIINEYFDVFDVYGNMNMDFQEQFYSYVKNELVY